MLADLPYELPSKLEAESYMEAISWLNRIPNKTTGPATTPQTLFTGVKPFIPKYFWGQTGIFYDKRADPVERRGIWGIFIGYGSTSKYLRCCDPINNTVTSKRKFDPSPTYPTAWNLKPRLRKREPKPRSTPLVPGKQLPPPPLSPPSVPTPAPEVTDRQPVNAQRRRILPDPPQASVPSEGALPTPSAPGPPPVSPLWTPIPLSEGALTSNHPPPVSSISLAVPPSPEGGIEQELPSVHGPTASPDRVARPPRVVRPRIPAPMPVTGVDSSISSTPTTTVPVSTSVQVTSDAQTTSRTRRTHVGSWKDGPSGAKGQDYITAKHHKSHFTISEPFSVIAMKASLKAALQNRERKSTIIQAINAEIDNFEQPGVLAPTKFGDIPPEYRKHIIGV